MTFGDMGDPAQMGLPPEAASGVMHSALTVSESVVVYASDLMDPDDTPKNGHVALSGDEQGVLTGWFNGLADGGTIDIPLRRPRGATTTGRSPTSSRSPGWSTSLAASRADTSTIRAWLSGQESSSLALRC